MSSELKAQQRILISVVSPTSPKKDENVKSPNKMLRYIILQVITSFTTQDLTATHHCCPSFEELTQK